MCKEIVNAIGHKNARTDFFRTVYFSIDSYVIYIFTLILRLIYGKNEPTHYSGGEDPPPEEV
jgi:hypothetical protein